MELKIETNTTADEITEGAKVYFRKYRAVRTYVLFGLAAAAFCVNAYIFAESIAEGDISLPYGGFTAVCAFLAYRFISSGAVFIKNIRKKLAGTNPEIQAFKFYKDRFETETYAQDENSVKGVLISLETTPYNQEIYYAETDGNCVIIVNRAMYYVIPKRFADADEINLLREIFGSENLKNSKKNKKGNKNETGNNADASE